MHPKHLEALISKRERESDKLDRIQERHEARVKELELHQQSLFDSLSEIKTVADLRVVWNDIQDTVAKKKREEFDYLDTYRKGYRSYVELTKEHRKIVQPHIDKILNTEIWDDETTDLFIKLMECW